MAMATALAAALARRLARRQVRARIRPRLPDRHPGAGAPADAAAPARQLAGPQHRRLRLRLPRLAARRPRPGAVEGAEVPRARAHQVPAGPQRGPRGDRVWGTQQVNLYPGAKYDGVFAMWYGKGPGVDRCGDVFKHANFAGTSQARRRAGARRRRPRAPSPRRCRTSRDHVFSAAMIPVLYPSACRRSSTSACTAGRCRATRAAGSASRRRRHGRELGRRSYVDPTRVKIIVPDDFPLPPDGVSIRWPDAFLAQEARMQDYKVYAALHYCARQPAQPHRHRFARSRGSASSPRGKSYLDVRQALDDLGIDERDAAEIGIRVLQGRHALAARARGRARNSPRGWRRSWSSRRSGRSSSTS